MQTCPASQRGGERDAEGRVLEVTHEGCGVEKADGGDAEAGVRGGGHLSLGLASAC